MPNSPLLWGPNNTSNNLQNQILNPNGSLLAYNGNKNYIQNASFENQLTTGWSLGTTGTLTNGIPTGSPTFGSGASGNLSIAIVTSNQIAGLASLSYASSAATTAGNMLATDAFTIDKEDQAQVLNFSISYIAQTNPGNANWSGTSSNSFAVAIYDVTNSAWIIPGKPFNFIQSSGVGKCTGSFQTSSNGTSYRMVVYNANATSGAITVYFDDFVVGPQANSSSSAVISWNGSNASQSLTANTTNMAFTTIKDSNAAWNGTQYVVPIAGDYLVTMSCTSSANAAFQGYLNGSVYNSNSFAFAIAGGGAIAAGSLLFTNCKPGDLISIRSTVTTTVTNNSAGIFQIGGGSVGPAGQVVAASAYLSANFVASSTTPINFDTKLYDTTNSITTSATAWKFSAPTSGIYSVKGTLQNNGPQNVGIILYKNGSAYQALGVVNTSYGGSYLSLDVQLNAGDFIDVRPTISNTYNGGSLSSQSTGYIAISLIQGPSSQQANPTVAASYWTSANVAASTTTAINFDSKEFDYTNSVSTGTWKFTAPATGLYSFAGYLASSTGSTTDYKIYKNGSAYKLLCEGTASFNASSFSTAIQLNAGDTADIRPSGSVTMFGTVLANGLNCNIVITKVG